MNVLTDGRIEQRWNIERRTGEGYTRSWQYNPSADNVTFVNWPAGTAGFITVAAPSFSAQWNATVTGNTMTISEPSSVTDLVPNNAEIVFWVNIGNGNESLAAGHFLRTGH